MRLVAEMVGELGAHRALHHTAHQIGQQAAGPDDLLLAPRARQKLIDQLVRQTIAILVRQTIDRARRGRRRLA